MMYESSCNGHALDLYSGGDSWFLSDRPSKCQNGAPNWSQLLACRYYSILQSSYWIRSSVATGGQSAILSVLVSSPHLGPNTRFLLLSDSCGFVHVGSSLWREDGSVVYSRRWSSPAHWFCGLSPAGPMTVFYCLIFGSPPTRRARSPDLYPPGTGWHSYTPRHWVTFSTPRKTLRATVEVFELRFHTLVTHLFCWSSLYSLGTECAENNFRRSFYCYMCIRFRGSVFIDPLLSNGRLAQLSRSSNWD
jgi:hypothetical protein